MHLFIYLFFVSPYSLREQQAMQYWFFFFLVVLVFEVMFLCLLEIKSFHVQNCFFYFIFSGEVTEDFIKKAQRRTRIGRKISPSSSSSEGPKRGWMTWVGFLFQTKKSPTGNIMGWGVSKMGTLILQVDHNLQNIIKWRPFIFNLTLKKKNCHKSF